MALIEYDVYKQKLRDMEPELTKLSAALDIEAAKQEASRLEAETAMDGFWNDLARSQKVQMRLKQLQNKITRHEKLFSAWEDLVTLCEMGQEEDDADILEELKAEYETMEKKVEETVKDENGQEVEFSIIDNVASGGERYLLVVETELMDDDETDAVILKEISINTDDVTYELVEDEAEFDRVADLFAQKGEDYTVEID